MALNIQINWDTYKNLKIIDVHKNLREKVINFILEYFPADEIFKVLKIPEEPGAEKDIQIILKHLLENDCSIAAVDNKTNEIQAVALLKCMPAVWRSWTNLKLLISNERFMELLELVRYCLEQHAKKNQEFSEMDSLHLFCYYMQEFEDDANYKARFFNAISEVARHMHMPRVTYMCLNSKHWNNLQEAGFTEIVRVLYSMYVYKGRRPFDRLRDINEMFGCLYEKRLQPIIPFNDLIIRHEKSQDDKQKKEGKENATSKQEIIKNINSLEEI